MAGAIFTLGGLNQLKDVFGQIPVIVQKGLDRLEQETAFAVKNSAQSRAPRDRGDLANAISAQRTGKSWIVGVIDSAIPSRGGRNSAHLNPAVYGVWYEYGFKHRNILRHPFMRPAAEAETPRWEAGVDRLGKEIEQATAASGGGS